jgi:hypothetical protein
MKGLCSTGAVAAGLGVGEEVVLVAVKIGEAGAVVGVVAPGVDPVVAGTTGSVAAVVAVSGTDWDATKRGIGPCAEVPVVVAELPVFVVEADSRAMGPFSCSGVGGISLMS